MIVVIMANSLSLWSSVQTLPNIFRYFFPPRRVADIFALITSYSLKVDRETTGGCPTSRAFRDVGIPTADTEERARTFDTVDERK